jgi:hypothetical protein
MPATPDQHADPELQFLRELADASAPIAGDVAKLGDHAWAIHGVVPVDGEVMLAEFDSYDEARVVLDQLPVGLHSTSDP